MKAGLGGGHQGTMEANPASRLPIPGREISVFKGPLTVRTLTTGVPLIFTEDWPAGSTLFTGSFSQYR